MKKTVLPRFSKAKDNDQICYTANENFAVSFASHHSRGVIEWLFLSKIKSRKKPKSYNYPVSIPKLAKGASLHTILSTEVARDVDFGQELSITCQSDLLLNHVRKWN